MRDTVPSQEVVGELQRGLRQVEAVVTSEEKLLERITEIEKALAVSSDQMQTIMGDHDGFADVLKELGESGALPSGERRAYGGYGN